MNIKTVTVTGADDSVDPVALAVLSSRFPFVEWGILLSRARGGTPRFPSLEWIRRLASLEPRPRLSGHLCGAWVRDLAWGENKFVEDHPEFRDLFDRVQLNFHAQRTEVQLLEFVIQLKNWNNQGQKRQFIFQLDTVNDSLFRDVLDCGVNAVPLFDASGGAGVEPSSWPVSTFPYAGYAGGLHPAKLDEQLDKIAIAAGDRDVWIDVETHVRSADDTKLDLSLVEEFLTKAETYMKNHGRPA